MKRLLWALAIVSALTLVSLAVLAPRFTTAHAAGSTRLTLVAYSTPQEAYAQLIPAFEATPAGREVTFSQSYGASGAQSRAVAAGLQADVVNLSLAPDVTPLVQSGLVSPDWNANAYGGFVTDSVSVFVVRPGNPKHITTWADLVKPGVQVVMPNPFASGAARWNVMAAYGAELREHQSPAEAQAYLKQLFAHVVSQDKSSRDALQTFVAGRGDVLLTYENEAILAERNHQPVSYVIPTDTILIQAPLAVIATSRNRTAAEAFAGFLYSVPAQRIFAENGYRPVVQSVLDQFRGSFPTPPGLFTIDDVGGWNTVDKAFFDPSTGIVASIEGGLGVSAHG